MTAVATAFASYDLLMSTDPHWFSTIFGVYYFGGGFLGGGVGVIGSRRGRIVSGRLLRMNRREKQGESENRHQQQGVLEGHGFNSGRIADGLLSTARR